MLLVAHNYYILGADHVELIVVHPTSKMVLVINHLNAQNLVL